MAPLLRYVNTFPDKPAFAGAHSVPRQIPALPSPTIWVNLFIKHFQVGFLIGLINRVPDVPIALGVEQQHVMHRPVAP